MVWMLSRVVCAMQVLVQQELFSGVMERRFGGVPRKDHSTVQRRNTHIEFWGAEKALQTYDGLRVHTSLLDALYLQPETSWKKKA